MGDKAFYYVSVDGVLVKVDIENFESANLDIGDETIYSAVASPDGSRIYAKTMKHIYVIDASAMKEKASFSPDFNVFISSMYVADNNDEVYFSTEDENGAKSFIGIDVESGEIAFSVDSIRGNVNKCISVDNLLYIMSYSFLDNLNGKSYITAIDRTTGEVVWEKEEIGHLIKDLYYSVSAGRETLLCTYGNFICLLDAMTGESILNITIDGEALDCLTSSQGDYLLYNSLGRSSFISADIEKLQAEIDVIDCTELSLFSIAQGSFVGVPKNENRIVFYRYCKNGSAEKYEGDIAEAEAECQEKREAVVEWAMAKGLPKASYASAYLEVSEIGMTFVDYDDDTLEVYQTDSMELVNTYNTEGWTLSYLGKVNGYYVINDCMAGLLFDGNGELCAKIPYFIGLTKDKDRVVVYGRDDNGGKCHSSIPVYSIDEIKEKAKSYLSDK